MKRCAWMVAALAASSLGAQVIEFESGGLRYQTLTREGVTIMFAPLSAQVREWSILQVAVSNGSSRPWIVRPEGMRFLRTEGAPITASPARQVVSQLVEKAGRNDVVRLVTTYEMALYGMQQFRSTNGYEQRRQAAFAEVGSTRLKAAAAASAIAFVETRLTPGQSTDGAVFFRTAGKPLGPGRLEVTAGGTQFLFDPIGGQ